MKSERRLEILEAFACSKPTEFDGFLKLYEEQHLEVIEPIVLVSVTSSIEEISTPKRKRKSANSEAEAAETP